MGVSSLDLFSLRQRFQSYPIPRCAEDRRERVSLPLKGAHGGAHLPLQDEQALILSSPFILVVSPVPNCIYQAFTARQGTMRHAQLWERRPSLQDLFSLAEYAERRPCARTFPGARRGTHAHRKQSGMVDAVSHTHVASPTEQGGTHCQRSRHDRHWIGFAFLGGNRSDVADQAVGRYGEELWPRPYAVVFINR